MNAQARGFSRRTTTGALLALAVTVWLAPTRAHACSQHVVVRSEALAGLDLLRPGSTAEGPARPAGFPLPCHGPSCSGRDSLPSPLPIPAVPAVVRVEAWGLGLPPCIPETTTRGSWDATPREAPVHALLRPLLVDRPPRSVALRLI